MRSERAEKKKAEVSSTSGWKERATPGCLLCTREGKRNLEKGKKKKKDWEEGPSSEGHATKKRGHAALTTGRTEGERVKKKPTQGSQRKKKKKEPDVLSPP